MIDTFTATGFTHWPVADLAADRWLHVPANVSAREVGSVMAALLPHGLDDAGGEPRGIVGLLREIAQAESLIVSGGLLARDTVTGVTIAPSCCCGLEGWREWVLVLSGGQPWLGHSPSPWVEHFDGAVRIWPDGGMGEDFPPIAGTITAPLDTVAALLHAAHQDLRGFLSVARRWVQEIAPSVAGDLTAKLDEGFQITRNLAV